MDGHILNIKGLDRDVTRNLTTCGWITAQKALAVIHPHVRHIDEV